MTPHVRRAIARDIKNRIEGYEEQAAEEGAGNNHENARLWNARIAGMKEVLNISEQYVGIMTQQSLFDVKDTEILDFMEQNPDIQFSYQTPNPAFTAQQPYWRRLFAGRGPDNEFPTLRYAVSKAIKDEQHKQSNDEELQDEEV